MSANKTTACNTAPEEPVFAGYVYGGNGSEPPVYSIPPRQAADDATDVDK